MSLSTPLDPSEMSALSYEIGTSIEEAGMSVEKAITAVLAIQAVPNILRVICQNTGMGFATVARVTDGTWTACAVRDEIGFGLEVGGDLDLKTTLCYESRMGRKPIVIDKFSEDPHYRGHHTGELYGLESYVSVPIILSDGTYFGNLCAIDRKPAQVSNAATLRMFEVFANLIALQLENDNRVSEVAVALSDERETSQLREQFIAVLGHDLRNPLSAVSATADILMHTRTEPDLIRLGHRLQATTFRMARLIDDVMDFARGRLGSGIGVTLASTSDLENALQDVVGELRAAHPSREINATFDLEQTVRCDRVRIQQLLSNLLGNAITHGSDHLPITVVSSVENGHLVVSVTNGGDIIGPETLGKVFEPYWRAASSKPGGGLGLGLYICKQIVKAHSGILEVRSSAEEGTCFVARMPV